MQRRVFLLTKSQRKLKKKYINSMQKKILDGLDGE